MLNRAGFGAGNRAEAVNRVAQCVDGTADHRIADRNICCTAGALDDGTLVQTFFAAEQDNADAVALQVQHNAADTGLKLNQFAVNGAVETVYSRNAVADFEHCAGLCAAGAAVILFNLLLENGYNFV